MVRWFFGSVAMAGFLDGRVVEAVGWGLVHSVWELGVVAVLVWGILRAVPRGMARVRYGVGLVGMGVMVVCVVGTVWELWPAGTRAISDARRVSGGEVAVERLLIIDHPQAMAAQGVTGSVGTLSARGTGMEPRVLGWVVWGYLVGVAACCLRLVGMWAGMVRVGRGAMAAREGVRGWARELAGRMGMGMVRVVESAAVEVPLVVGVLRPMVVVPVMAVTGLSERELMALLAHEMAHIRRWDPVVNAVQCVVEAVLFYHPGVWWVSRVIREERECCCDDVAVEVVGDRAGYAGALAAMEGLRAGAGGRLAIGAGSGKLAGRVERLLGRRRELHGGRGWAVATCVMAALAVAMGVWVAGCAGGGTGRAKERIVGDGEVVEKVYDMSDMLVPTGKAELVMPAAGREDGVWKGNWFAAANDQTMAGIKETVETIVAPDKWKDKGGKVGEIVLKPNGLMAVTQTGANQTAVKTLLEQLRETRVMRIGVKCELLLMSKEAYDAWGMNGVTLPLQGQVKWSGTIVDRYQWGQFDKLMKDKGAVVSGSAETEVLNGQALGVRLAGKAVSGGVRMAVQSTASADRRFVVWSLATKVGPGEAGEKQPQTLVSVPEKGATLCLFLGKVAVAGGEDKYGVWAMRAGIVEGSAKMEQGWGFSEEASDAAGAERWQNAAGRRDAAKRADAAAAQERERAENARTQENLGREIDVVSNGQMTLKDALERVQNAAGVNVLVNWKAVEAAGVSRTTPATVNLRRVTAEKALKEILNEAGGAKVSLRYRIEDGVVTVSTVEDLQTSKYQVIRVFDIRDLVMVPMNLPLALPKVGEKWQGPSKEEQAKAVAQATAQVIDTLETIVQPNTWREKGGKVGSIRELNGQLIVNQTPENQEAIYKLLQQLRETHAVQISVESRICLLTDGEYGKLVRAYPGLVAKDQRAVLDDAGVKGLLEGLQGDGSTVTVTAPRITLFNGYAGWLGMGERGEGKWGFMEAVEATVTADRKGVVGHLKLGVPADVRDVAKGQREVDVLGMVADRAILMVNCGETVGEQGEVRRVVWLVRPTVIVQREVEAAELATQPVGR